MWLLGSNIWGSLMFKRETGDGEKGKNRWERMQRWVENWQQEAMFQHLLKRPTLRPRLTLAKLVMYLLSLAVHLSTVLVWVAAAYYLFTDGLGGGERAFGVILVLMGLALRPRFNSIDDEPLPREQYPRLFALIDRVAAQVGVKPPDHVVYSYHYNATFSRAGLRNRSVLHLGMGLWMKLTPEARVALIAHELAHDANGDFGRNWMIYNALFTLVNWYIIFVPYRVIAPYISLWESIIYFLLYLITRPIYLLIWVYVLLLMYESRRAEYMADALAAQVAGTHAVTNLHRFFPQRPPDDDFSPLYFSHPPEAYRIRFLEARPRQFPNVISTEAEMRQIDAELAKPYQYAQRELDKLGVVDY